MNGGKRKDIGHQHTPLAISWAADILAGSMLAQCEFLKSADVA